MRCILVSLIFFSVAIPSYPQSPVIFKIITVSGTVTIDGKQVLGPMDVTSSSRRLLVSSIDGSVGIITYEGYPFRLEDSMDISDVNGFVAERLEAKEVRMERCCPMSTPLVRGEMVGDSLFVYWTGTINRDNTFNPPPNLNFQFRLTGINDQLNESHDTGANWILLDIMKFKSGNDEIRFQVRTYNGPKQDWTGGTIRTASSETIDKTHNDLKAFSADIDYLFYQCAYNHLHDLGYDELFAIYRILAKKKVATDPILQKFFSWLVDKYALHYVTIDNKKGKRR